jgi:hypothetical protein
MKNIFFFINSQEDAWVSMLTSVLFFSKALEKANQKH